MASLLDAIHARQAADRPPVEREPLVVTHAEWDAWDGSDASCPWKAAGPNRWQHETTGEIYEWGQPYVLPGDGP